MMLDKRAVVADKTRREQTDDVRGKSGKNRTFIHIIHLFFVKKKKKEMTEVT